VPGTFTQAPPRATAWPIGDYRVDFYPNDQLVVILRYAVAR
jgi:hypothetical protein